MNKLTNEKSSQVISCLVEGFSIRATMRMTGVSKNTVAKLLVDVGEACSVYQDNALRNLTCNKIQCNEFWSFYGARQKNDTEKRNAAGWGDAWTWTAIDEETMIVPCWFVGTRDAGAARHFIHGLAARLAHRVQLTTDGRNTYLSAVEDDFLPQIDYAMLTKVYGEGDRTEARYSPAQCMETRTAATSGQSEISQASRSVVGCTNLTMNMGMRRFPRLTNAFSRKVQNHSYAIALHFMHYNFCQIHQTLRCTPAMEAGVSTHVWDISEIVALLSA